MKYLFHAHSDIYKALKTTDYQKAAYKQFKLAQKEHPTFKMTSWFEGRELKLLPDVSFAETGEYEIDWGKTYRGKSVDTVRREYKKPYMSLLQFLRFVTDYPKVFKKWHSTSQDIWGLDFPGDQLRDGGGFALSPCVYRGGGEPLLEGRWAVVAYGDYGSSVFCWEGDLNLDDSSFVEPLAFDPSTLEVVINGTVFIPKP